MNWSAGAFFLLVLPFDVARTSKRAGFRGGRASAVHEVVEAQLTELASALPTLNVVAEPSANPLPVIVMLVPPATGPLPGSRLRRSAIRT